MPSQDYEEILSQIKGITNGDIQLHLVGPAVQNDVNHKYIKRLENTIKESMDSDNVAVLDSMVLQIQGISQDLMYLQLNSVRQGLNGMVMVNM